MTKNICAVTCAFLLAGGTLSSVVSAENNLPLIHVSQSGGGTGYGPSAATSESEAGATNSRSGIGKNQQDTEQQDVDNTGRNERDNTGTTMTPGDQSENESDVEMTRKIRSAVTDDNSLSTNAQNVKIITQNGKVTLRGPVNNQQERNKILSTAKKIAGQDKVEDQMEVRQSR